MSVRNFMVRGGVVVISVAALLGAMSGCAKKQTPPAEKAQNSLKVEKSV